MSGGSDRNGWPTPAQGLLLQAALRPGPDAVAAWERWKAGNDVDRIDQGSYRLLPLVYRMLERERADDPLRVRLKGVYRHTWARNQLMFRELAGHLQALRDAGLEAMILKGAALAETYYRDPGARPMDDIDVLVHTRDAERALALFLARGWRPELEMTPSRMRLFHGVALRDAAGLCLDLHWHLTLDTLAPDADEVFWAAALPARIGGVEARRLDPAHELFHALTHGLKSNVIPPLRWVADAAMILRQTPEIDWARLTAAAIRHRFVLPVREGLGYLAALLDAPIPPAVMADLHRAPVSRRERLEHWARASTPAAATWAAVVRIWFHWRRHADQAGVVTASPGFGGYLKQRFGARSYRELTRVLAAKGRRRLLAARRRGSIAITARRRGAPRP